MRKIESSIIQTMNTLPAGNGVRLSDRDVVTTTIDSNTGDKVTLYKLYGHVIAIMISNNNIAHTLKISSCHHQTATTKSRLNAILQAFTQSRLYQKKYEWYVTSLDGTTVPFTDGMMIQTLVNEF